MDAMLMLAAVNAFTSNPDEMFNHAKNFFWADFVPGTSIGNSNGKRMYFPWDLDSALQSTGSSIYGNGSEPYQQLILTDLVFRQQFNLTMLSLLNGPLSIANLTAFLDDMEPILTPFLEADENNQIGLDVEEHFDSVRNWVAARHANVHQQVIAEIGNVPIPGDFDLDNDVDGADFLEWQRGSSPTPLSASDLADWQNNYGFGTLVATSVVPEPSALLLLTVLGALTFRRSVAA
jgi:hypothetical protein